jgi:hypothetical protein
MEMRKRSHSFRKTILVAIKLGSNALLLEKPENSVRPFQRHLIFVILIFLGLKFSLY